MPAAAPGTNITNVRSRGSRAISRIVSTVRSSDASMSSHIVCRRAKLGCCSSRGRSAAELGRVSSSSRPNRRGTVATLFSGSKPTQRR